VREVEHAHVVSRNARNGLALFAVYLALYAGFMALTAFDPPRMARPALGGVNLAVVYGFGLIFGALVLALVYMFLARPRHDDHARGRAAAEADAAGRRARP
jgi:uncharacterized membrane protein (DUF485 family)